MNPKYLVQTFNTTKWDVVESFDRYQDALDYKKNIIDNKEYRIVKRQTVVYTIEEDRLICEKS